MRDRRPNHFDALKVPGRDPRGVEPVPNVLAQTSLPLAPAVLAQKEERPPEREPLRERNIRDDHEGVYQAVRSDNSQVVALKEAEQRAAAPLQRDLDREGRDEPELDIASAQEEAEHSSPGRLKRQRGDNDTYGAEPTRPGSRATKDDDRYLLPDGKEMTEAQRERFDRLMSGGFREVGREVTDPSGHLTEGRERGE